ncbi:hypothetical protein SteCoe_3801 [Stentor coeruleus]|uniref:Uncharacterized protein n=1 Tax=Stentor coeruleus TaxID=5963 RepID=A0A1R2CW45_9CILI|nr:hypothetical protein SteCoe_3801 [Stentor coeruleus]
MTENLLKLQALCERYNSWPVIRFHTDEKISCEVLINTSQISIFESDSKDLSLQTACQIAISKLKNYKSLPLNKRQADFPYLNPVRKIFSKKLLPFSEKPVDKSIGPEEYFQFDNISYDNWDYIKEVDKVLRNCEVNREWKRKVEKISESIGEIEVICKKIGVLELLPIELPCLAISPKTPKYKIKYYGSISHMDEDVILEITKEILKQIKKTTVHSGRRSNNSIVFAKLNLKITFLPWSSYKILHAQHMKSLIIPESDQKIVKLIKYWGLRVGFTCKKLAEIIGIKGIGQYINADWGFRKCLENIAGGMLLNGHYIKFLEYQNEILQRFDVVKMQKEAQGAIILLSQGLFYEIFEGSEVKD